MRKSDREVLREWCIEMEQPYPGDPDTENLLLVMVAKLREVEPRINAGFDICVLQSIWDDDDVKPETDKYFADKGHQQQPPL